MATKRETNCSDAELRRMMVVLRVSRDVDMETLKVSYYKEIKLHHTDKGGSDDKTKELTRAYRILRAYLEDGLQLPDPSKNNDDGAWGSGPTRPSFQPQQRASNPYAEREEESTFQTFSRRRRKREDGQTNGFSSRAQNDYDANIGREFGERSACDGGGGAAKDFRRAGRFRGFEEAQKSKHRHYDNYFWDDEEEENAASRFDVSKKTFANNYKYTNEDLSDYVDPFEKGGPSTEHCRIIRGGLVLLKDFHNTNAMSEFADLEFTRDFDDIEFYTNPKFEHILDRLQNNEESLYNLTEKMKTLVNLDWAMSRELQTDAKIRGVRLSKWGGEEDDNLYKFTVPMSCVDEMLNISSGIHVEVRSTVDENVFASAIVDSVIENTVVLFFLEPPRLLTVLANSQLVDLSVNASAFIFRSMLRSIEFVRQRCLYSIIYPKFEFSETYDEFESRRCCEIDQIDFLEGDGLNEFQKSAVYSIVSKVNRPYPFLLFGPPGTGKTMTLIEAIRQLILQSSNNRILVCTPSRMAADNFAETLLDKNFIDPKYVFRMHSMSTLAIGRNRKLDPISYMPKEGRGRFYGIPSRLNLRLFRVIISTLSTSSYLISAGGLRGHFTHVIIDEAGQATEADTWIPVGGLVDPKTTSLILAGDPRQLGPVVNINILKTHGYGVSMLKRLIYSEAYENSDDRTMVVLKQTYRSHFRILRPCSYLFYNNMLVANEEDEVLYKLCKWEGLPTKGFPIVFHSSSFSQEEPSSNKSFSNVFEAQLVLYYVEKLLRETDVKPTDIGIISPYKNQVQKLRTLLVKHPKLTIDSVEGFQGSEREVIIISTVRTHKIGFLQCDLRLNTSISRAKSLLIVIGNENLLSTHESWRKFIYYCRYHGGYFNGSGVREMVPVSPDEN